MKKTAFVLLLALLSLSMPIMADNSVNLTPVPYKMTIGEGKLILPQNFEISQAGLPDSIGIEAEKFAAHLQKVTGYTITVVPESEKALIEMSLYTGSELIGDEGYTLDITTRRITIAANTTHGFYYAFQSIKKMLPPCVMAGVKDSTVTEFTLPVVSIVDKPRFSYRGFMLDVCRHYFEPEQVKRMIDVMSYYKMNRFHWHLSDDQGWRIEIKKYPKLTTIGATRNNSWSVDPEYGGYYTNEPYGPYYYTQEEARELVAYAKERHIEIIPEIEFPGHACAALAAYPEFSCWPNGSHNVKVDGGVYADVFNVGNPATLEFAKDVLDEIVEIFPYNQMHIGGDECPTSAWSENAECKAMMQEMGFGELRELQSYFVKNLADHLAQKEGDKKRSVIMWNESLSASGTNVNMIDATEGTLMCWEQGKVQSSALQAAKLGLKSIITPIGPYYINRKQSTDPGEPVGAGYGHDNLQSTYEYVPIPTSVPIQYWKYYIGVQGTFWTEHVQSKYLLEYLALPRLIAIAETGWTQASKKNFEDFCKRITADSVLLNYNNYEYGRHFMKGEEGNETTEKVMPSTSTDAEKHWYRIVTGATDEARAGKCIELLREGSASLATPTAQVNRLWNGVAAEEGEETYDYQMWALMEDPSNPGKYAIVCKAKPNGSVNGTPTATNNTARWDYDDTARHYNFILGSAIYEKNGNYYRYSIHSDKAASGMYLNFAGSGQNYSINMWNDPSSGNGGVWEFRPADEQPDTTTIPYPLQGEFVRIINNVERFAGQTLIDDGKANVTVKKSAYAADVWEIATATTEADGQIITLKNVATGRYITGNTAPIGLGTTAGTYKNIYNSKTGDFSILAGEGAIFPMPERATTNPGTLNIGGIYPQGSAWRYEKAYLATYQCYDTNGTHIATYHRAMPAGKEHQCFAPEITNMQAKSYEIDGSNSNEAPTLLPEKHITVNVIYERTAYSVTINCIEQQGGEIQSITNSCPIGESITIDIPEIEYFSLLGSSVESGTVFAPTSDTIIIATYSTDAICGFAAVGDAVTEPVAGQSYLLFNNKNDNSRNGFLYVEGFESNISTNNSITSGSPAYVWRLEEGSNGRYKVANGYNYYIPTLASGSKLTASATGAEFSLIPNSNGSFYIKGINNLYWNGNSDHTFTGWSDGHPFILYSYKVAPYFNVGYTCVDEEGNKLGSFYTYIQAGETYILNIPTYEGYSFKELAGGNEGANIASKNIDIVITYRNNETRINEVISNKEERIYDLQGRHLKYISQPGIYIVNGKKVLINK